MRHIQKEEEVPTILGKIIQFLSKKISTKGSWCRIVAGWLALILLIVCLIISFFVYKFEFPFVQKKYESIIVKKIVNHISPDLSPPTIRKTLNDPPTIRRTLNGPVEGIEQTTALGQKFYSFRGIPFAEPPITGIDPYTGEEVDRRFKPPVPFGRNWTEILKVHDFREFCQPSDAKLPSDIQNYTVSENCLYMNVFVPAGGAEKKPVFVYVHGGGPGGGITDMLMTPDFFLAHDNVVVYLSFRVDLFGFMNLGIGDYTGNMALKDQQLGMKWVYDNIEFFSGNKNEILLFGDSIGSTCVHGHMLNAESRKYFTRVYMVSGTVSPWKLSSGNQLSQVYRCLGFKGTHAELVDYIKTASAATLTRCNWLAWILHIESPNATKPFITQTPDEIYDSNEPPVVDAMFTFASEESVKIFPGITGWKSPLLNDWRGSKLTLPYENFNLYSHPNEYQKVIDKLKKVYYPTNSSDFEEVKRINIDYMSDIMVRDHVLKSVALQADANTKSSDKSRHKKTYIVRVSMHSDLNAMETQYKKNYTGTAHSDDLCYMFYCRFLDSFNVTEPHIIKKDHVYDMIMRNVKRMTNFARYGDPSIEGDTPFKSCQSSNEIYCHEVSNEPKMRITTDIRQQLKYDLWREIDDIYKNRNRK